MTDANIGPVPSTENLTTNSITGTNVTTNNIAGNTVSSDGSVSTPKHAAVDAYTPVFPDLLRTIIYVAALIASVVSLGITAFGDPAVGGYIGTAAGIIAGGFGVAYNPVRLSGK